MIPSPFHLRRNRSFVHGMGKSQREHSLKHDGENNGNKKETENFENLCKRNHDNVKKSTPSLKLCKKWLIGELKRVKKENLLLKSHLIASDGNELVSLKQKLATSQQKKSALRRKYKALVHIHKSSLVELYNLAATESDALRNDISLLANVIQRLSGELDRYENESDGQHKGTSPDDGTDKVAKLASLREVRVFSPLMRAYDSLLDSRASLIGQQRGETARLRKLYRSAAVECRELSKQLASCESRLATNVHRLESLSINKDLLTEQNEVLIQKIHLFNTSLHLLLSKYESLEIQNLQLRRQNNSLRRAATLVQMRSQSLHPTASAASKVYSTERLFHAAESDPSERDQPERFIDRTIESVGKIDESNRNDKETGESFTANAKADGHQAASEGTIDQRTQSGHERNTRLGRLDAAIHGRPQPSRNTTGFAQLTSGKESRKMFDGFFGLATDEEMDDQRVRQQDFVDVTVDQSSATVEMGKTIIELKREVLLLKERNAMLHERNVDEHNQCISKRVHESIVQYLQSMFDELTRKYRESNKTGVKATEAETQGQWSEQEKQQKLVEKERTHLKGLEQSKRLQQQRTTSKLLDQQQQSKIFEKIEQSKKLQEQRTQSKMLEQQQQSKMSEKMDQSKQQQSTMLKEMEQSNRLQEQRTQYKQQQLSNMPQEMEQSKRLQEQRMKCKLLEQQQHSKMSEKLDQPIQLQSKMLEKMEQSKRLQEQKTQSKLLEKQHESNLSEKVEQYKKFQEQKTQSKLLDQQQQSKMSEKMEQAKRLQEQRTTSKQLKQQYKRLEEQKKPSKVLDKEENLKVGQWQMTEREIHQLNQHKEPLFECENSSREQERQNRGQLKPGDGQPGPELGRKYQQSSQHTHQHSESEIRVKKQDQQKQLNKHLTWDVSARPVQREKSDERLDDTEDAFRQIENNRELVKMDEERVDQRDQSKNMKDSQQERKRRQKESADVEYTRTRL